MRQFGSTVIVAPHPDDESLGCGGLLALLANTAQRTNVLVMTDGSRSHPGSLSYSSGRLAAVREQETIDALAILGVRREHAHFLRYQDTALPARRSPGFSAAVTRLRETLIPLSPDTLLVPWRRDPHGDHEATWQLVHAAAADLSRRPRWLEYPIWAWTCPDRAAAPQPTEADAWRLDIAPVAALKARAIAQHRSQLGALIDDDPGGFVLEPSMLVHFAHPWELFLEPADE